MITAQRLVYATGAQNRMQVRMFSQQARKFAGPATWSSLANHASERSFMGYMNSQSLAALGGDNRRNEKQTARGNLPMLAAWSPELQMKGLPMQALQTRAFSPGAPPPGQPPRRDDDEYYREEEPPKRTGLLSRGIGAVATGAVILGAKMKWVIGALKFTKLMPALSMLASTGAYAIFYGWPFAAGMVGLIGIHEYGHLRVMQSLGIPAGPAIFIPFMGAFVEMKDRPKDVREEALVAFGGPVLGGAAAVATSVVGVQMDSQMLISLADFGIMINLFNLLPIGQLDGGRIGGAISPWFLVAGLGAGGAMAYQGMIHNPIFFLIMLSGAFSTYDRFFGTGTHPTYYLIPPGQKFILSGAYVALIVFLLAAMAWNQQYRKSLRQLRAEDPTRGHSELSRQLEGFADEWADEPHGPSDAEKEFMERYFRDE